LFQVPGESSLRRMICRPERGALLAVRVPERVKV
jgi:hypothetical protein